MSVYDVQGNVLIYDNYSLPERDYKSAPKTPHLKGFDDFDMSTFDIVRTFTPFETDYSCPNGSPRVLDISSDEFLDTFYNVYLGWSADGSVCVTKKALGYDETNTYIVWAYDFKPQKPKRKILLTSGMHTFELPASFGLARWIKEYMTSSDAVFQYMRENVEVCCIPIINPWGWNQLPQKIYPNSNGVNPARNFNDWNNIWESYPSYTPAQTEYNVKGDHPWSEAETVNYTNWLKDNSDALFHIDCHTGYGNNNGEVWIYYLSNHPYISKITSAYNALLDNYRTYQYSGTVFGTVYVDHDTTLNQRYIQNNLGLPTMTLEQSGGTVAWGNIMPNNNKADIAEYAKQIHAFVVSQLQ